MVRGIYHTTWWIHFRYASLKESRKIREVTQNWFSGCWRMGCSSGRSQSSVLCRFWFMVGLRQSTNKVLHCVFERKADRKIVAWHLALEASPSASSQDVISRWWCCDKLATTRQQLALSTLWTLSPRLALGFRCYHKLGFVGIGSFRGQQKNSRLLCATAWTCWFQRSKMQIRFWGVE